MSDDDSALLRRYADEKSEAAFAALVRRHLDLVYAVALRQVGGDAHLAQEVAQTVFTALARKAAHLAARPVLGGWLYRTTQFTAIDAVRAESRRRTREQEASTMDEFSGTANPSAAIDWEKLRPTLDRAIGELSDDDRDAVVLRFFDGKSFAAIGAKLRLTENTARMRVDRALDKLHAALARGGVTSTTAALAMALANQPAVATPVGLAGVVTGTALAGAGATASLWTFMITTKTVLGIVGGTAAIAAAIALYHDSLPPQSELTAVRAEKQSLEAKVRELESQAAVATTRAREADEDTGRLIAAIAGAPSNRLASGEESSAPATPITHEVVDARYKHAQELARSGDFAAALKEFLWCYDVGMLQVASYAGVRSSFLLSAIYQLGARYPAAFDALRERRDQAEQRMVGSASDNEAAMAFASINRTLKDDQATLALYDKLPPDDPRRRTLANAAYEQLVSAQRYVDALAGRSYASMSSLFELQQQERPLPPNITDPERLRAQQRTYAVTSTAKSIEVLAGAGDLDHARALTDRLLAYDSTEATKTILRDRLTRAGHPELLNAAMK